MTCNLLLAWTFLLVASVPLLAHPITDSAELPYLDPLSEVDGGAGTPDEQTFLPQDGRGLRYPSLLSELSKQGLSTAGLLPRQMKRDVFLDKQSLVNPLSRYFGIRKQFRKREGTSECFWKYCV
ncbi:urotensin-2-like [Esox lucius]|uniref:Urotensin-2 n=1 Tax=Esox lucius TaxID=8010 RepID=A0A3P8Z082_ESOLU|nr:urotensin-2-like [Esox lucius]